MKQILFILGVLVLFIVPSSLVVAQSASQDTADQQNQSTIEDRTKERKSKLKITLDTVKANSLKKTCKPAQQKLEIAAKRIKDTQNNRAETYENLITTLNTAKDTITQAGQDTVVLNKSITKLTDAVAKYNVAMSSYQVAVNDAATLKCQDNPEAFWLSLNEARSLVADIDKVHTQIKDQLKDEVKSELVELRKELDQPVQPVQEEQGDGTE